jgi:DNA-binding transcriptional LysR family regulator
MHEMHLGAVDLNLLVALDALLRERSVTRAARHVGLSPSAMSHALARLRAFFGDPLLVRGQRGMVPTERAESLEAPLREALAAIEGLLGAGARFDPATARASFVIAAEDYGSTLLLPALLTRLRAEAPGIDLDVVGPTADLHAKLERKEVDLSIGVVREPPAALRVQRLFDDGFACVVRRGHPRVKARLTLQQYVELPHARIGTGVRGPSVVDEALAKRGLRRRVALRIGHFLAAPLIVAETDLVLTLPRRLALKLQAMAPLVVHEPPLELSGITISQAWHERRQADSAHAWLRQRVAATVAAWDARSIRPEDPSTGGIRPRTR